MFHFLLGFSFTVSMHVFHFLFPFYFFRDLYTETSFFTSFVTESLNRDDDVRTALHHHLHIIKVVLPLLPAKVTMKDRAGIALAVTIVMV